MRCGLVFVLVCRAVAVVWFLWVVVGFLGFTGFVAVFGGFVVCCVCVGGSALWWLL